MIYMTLSCRLQPPYVGWQLEEHVPFSDASASERPSHRVCECGGLPVNQATEIGTKCMTYVALL